MRLTQHTVCIIFAIMTFLLLPTMSMAGNSPSGTISGRVLNATLGREGVNGLDVVLGADAGGKKVDVRHAETDPKGFFSFQGIQADKEMTYHLWTRYKNIEYVSKAVRFGKGKTQTVDLPVYDTTDQDSDIFIKINHVFLDKSQDFFQISEALIIENRGNKVYVGSQDPPSGKNETLHISLPKEATNLQFEQRSAPFMIKTADGFIDISEIRPGTKRILFSYVVKAHDFNTKLIINLPYRTNNVSVVFPEKGLTVKSRQLAFMQQVENSGRRFFLLSGKDFAKGSRVILDLDSVNGKKLFRWVVVGMLVLLVFAGAVIPLIKRRDFRYSADERIAAGESMNAFDQRQTVIQAIARLDDLRESGGIDSETYRKQRKELMIKAKALSRRRDGDENSSSEASEI